MKKHFRKIQTSMSFNIIGTIILLLALLGAIVSAIGYFSFSNAFRYENAVTTYHMADTAATLINGDHLEAYLAGEEMEEYELSKQYLDAYCKKIHVSLIYVILVDRSDYGRFVSVVNPVDNTVDNTTYTEWELGHKRDTTNDEYRTKYRAIYEKQAPYETVYRTNPSDGHRPHITTMVPVLNSAGDVAGILCMQRPMRELDDVLRPYLRRIGISTIVLAVTAALLAAVHLRKQFVKPIGKVSAEASRFAKENTKGVELGEISRISEIASLAASIDTMETDMVNYVENLTTVTAERERIGTELSFARSIQENSIPNIFPAFPEREDFDIYASMTPAKEVGGDFYNFFLLDDDHLMMLIGDVSGKGVPGALFMMVSNILLSDRARMGGTPADVFRFVNKNICEHNRSDMFVTLWMGILEISTGKIIAANAGHEDAVICRRNGDFELFKTKHNIVIGAFPDAPYNDFEITLEKGDKIFLYTDGVPEAADSSGGFFTIERMVDTLNANKEDSPRVILDAMRRNIFSFQGGAPQFDDVTMLCLELK